MNENDLPEPNDNELVAQVVSAFEQVQVPPAPAARETADFVERADRGGTRRGWQWPIRRLTARQRMVAGGLGLSTIAALILVVLALISSRSLSAMERMARRLEKVKSYSYRVESVATETQTDPPRVTTWKSDGPTYWQAPSALRSELTISESSGHPAVPRSEKVLEHFAEIYPAGKMGLFIDYLRKTYRRLPYEPVGSTMYPLDLLRIVREDSGEVTRELGMKEIGGKIARGYVLAVKGSREPRMKHPLEVWVDSDTDLPLRFGYRASDESTTTEWWATDFRWNAPLDKKLFEPAPPWDFDDITPPEDDKPLKQIAAALALYARLSGGHYPRVDFFDNKEIRDEMRKLVGFKGPPQAEWKSDPKFQEIEQAAVGLDWIARILRNRHHAEYRGWDVGPADKDKLLLWWRVWGPQRYRVFYGDLRTELLTPAQAAKLGLTESSPE